MSPIKTIASAFNVLTDIITSITTLTDIITSITTLTDTTTSITTCKLLQQNLLRKVEII